MNIPDLLGEMRRLGVTLEARGDRLRFRPAKVLPPALLNDLRVHKAQLLEELRRDAEPDPELDLTNLPDAEIRKIRAQLRPRLIRLACYGEVWLTHTDKMAAEVGENERYRGAPRPVVLIDDLTGLRTKSPAMIRLTMNVMKVFPGSRVIK